MERLSVIKDFTGILLKMIRVLGFSYLLVIWGRSDKMGRVIKIVFLTQFSTVHIALQAMNEADFIR